MDVLWCRQAAIKPDKFNYVIKTPCKGSFLFSESQMKQARLTVISRFYSDWEEQRNNKKGMGSTTLWEGQISLWTQYRRRTKSWRNSQYTPPEYNLLPSFSLPFSFGQLLCWLNIRKYTNNFCFVYTNSVIQTYWIYLKNLIKK